MKILLCALNAKYIHTNIALRFIREYCSKKINAEFILREYTINYQMDDIIKDIYSYKPDVISFSCYIWNIEMIKKAADIVKIILPDTVIIAGGPEVTYNSADFLENNPQFDYIIRGEGERTSLELYSTLLSGGDISDIDGVSFRNSSGTAVVNKDRAPMDMSELPFPYKDFDEIENRICYYEASRGCPFRCQYCLSSVEPGVRFAPIEKVKKELSLFIDKRVKQVKFVDRTFNANNIYASEIVRHIIANDNNFTNFHFEIAADILTDDFLDLLSTARKGLFQLEIGVQSTNCNTLDAIKRNGDFEKITKAVKRILKFNNIHIHLDLIAGLPYENTDSFRNSYNDVYSLRPHQLQLGFLKVLHGSGMEKMCEEFSIKYSPYSPYEVLSTHCLSYDDVLYLKKIEDLTETYYNSNRFVNSVNYLTDHCESPFDMFAALAEYRSENYIDNITHNKNDTYSFLINSLVKFKNADPELFKWILKFDHILNERPKGNPDWTSGCMNLLTKEQIYDMTARKKIFSDHFEDLRDADNAFLISNTHIEKMPYDPVTLEKKDTIILCNYTKRDLYNNAEFIKL